MHYTNIRSNCKQQKEQSQEHISTFPRVMEHPFLAESSLSSESGEADSVYRRSRFIEMFSIYHASVH